MARDDKFVYMPTIGYINVDNILHLEDIYLQGSKRYFGINYTNTNKGGSVWIQTTEMEDAYHKIENYLKKKLI